MKRFFALIFVVALCLSILPAAAAAEVPDFTDVKQSNYYYSSVRWAAESGITTGVSSTLFGASEITTRAQVVTFLWRLAGAPAPNGSSGFSDVPQGKWFSASVSWAAENGVVNGYSAEVFAPDDPCTRQQAAAILYRFERLRGGGFEGSWAFVPEYADSELISAYAYEPLCWITAKGVMQGYDGRLDPNGLCNRAQFVTMLYRYATGTPAAAPQEHSYVEKEVEVVRDSLDSAETATLRYYEDMPNVPYMKLTSFYNQFYLVDTERTEGMTETTTGSVSVFENFAGYRMTADADADELICDELQGFAMLGYYLELALSGEPDEDYPYLYVLPLAVDPESPVPFVLRPGNYGIDLRMGEDGLYFPVGTLCDLFAQPTLYYVIYNGEKLYVVDYIGNRQENSAIYEDEHLCDAMAAGRSRDLTDFTYRELCLNVDAFYGHPGQEYIHDQLDEAGLDKLLRSRYPEVKGWLLSQNPSEYFGALYHLYWGLLYDGGHTAPISSMLDTILLDSNTIRALYDAPYIDGIYNYYRVHDVYDTLNRMQDTFYQGGYYMEHGDTAIIRIDGFDVDYEGWRAYYAGEGEMPFEDDALGTAYRGLQRAAANPAIKNVIFDVSTNGGGDTGALVALEWLATGEGYLLYRNAYSGQVVREEYLIDINSDGVFDEKDQPMTQFRYGVLTSSYSFSCANYFPCYMQEHGAMILGEQSRGGACCIRMNSTADGFALCSSCAGYILCRGNGESVDTGCPVDAYLVRQEGEPYAVFYDLSVLSAEMNEFYGAGDAD